MKQTLIRDNSSWTNASGCGILHPFNKQRREECEQARPKNLQAQADLLLAQAALEKQQKGETQSTWTATQTVMVIGASILAITLMVVIIKRAKSKKG